jgi:hypothetical protein
MERPQPGVCVSTSVPVSPLVVRTSTVHPAGPAQGAIHSGA